MGTDMDTSMGMGMDMDMDMDIYLEDKVVYRTSIYFNIWLIR
jgi:hypothetical protein